MPLMTSSCTLLPDPSSRIQPIRCHRGSGVVTVVMATPALLHLPALSLRPHVHPPSRLFRLCVYRAYPYMARSFNRAAAAGQKR